MNQNQNGQKNKAMTAAALRGVVAAYLVCLGYKIMTNKDTTMSPLMARLLGGAFIAAAAVFAVFIVLRWRADSKAAQNDKEQS